MKDTLIVGAAAVIVVAVIAVSCATEDAPECRGAGPAAAPAAPGDLVPAALARPTSPAGKVGGPVSVSKAPAASTPHRPAATPTGTPARRRHHVDLDVC